MSWKYYLDYAKKSYQIGKKVYNRTKTRAQLAKAKYDMGKAKADATIDRLKTQTADYKNKYNSAKKRGSVKALEYQKKYNQTKLQLDGAKKQYHAIVDKSPNWLLTTGQAKNTEISQVQAEKASDMWDTSFKPDRWSFGANTAPDFDTQADFVPKEKRKPKPKPKRKLSDRTRKSGRRKPRK